MCVCEGRLATVKILFSELAPRFNARNGGYSRIVRLGNRQGDNASMAMVELVDYNEIYNPKAKKKKATRRRGGKKSADTTVAAETAVEEKIEEPKSQDAENKDEA